MKKITIKGIKIYLVLFIYLFITLLIYSLLISKMNLALNKYVLITILGIGFLLLGFLYGNMLHKKGIIIGIIIGIIHYFLLYLIFMISNFEISFNIINMLLYSVLSGIGGILGVNFKKII